MVAIELLAIAAILVLQPLIALLWAYVAYRLVVGFTVSRAEEAIDGRIEHINNKIRNEVNK